MLVNKLSITSQLRHYHVIPRNAVIGCNNCAILSAPYARIAAYGMQ